MPWSYLILSLWVSLVSRAESSLTGEVGLSGGFLKTRESTLNPGNRIFETPGQDFLLDLRAEYRQDFENKKLIIRPRWTGTFERVAYGLPDEAQDRARGRLDLTDAYFLWDSAGSWQLTAGLFVEGWGPAEFVNPSNPFFDLKTESKSFFFKEKGKALIKAIWNPSPQTTLSLLAEPVSNNEAPLRAESEFHPQAALRAEWQSENASQIFGFLVGREYEESDFVGEYLQLRHDPSGFSLYWEARHTRDPRRFETVAVGPFQEIRLIEISGIRHYSVAGFRWEGRADARLEWIHYGLGYSQAEYAAILQSLSELSPYLVSNARRFSRPGLEFLSPHWISISVRIPELGPRKEWQWTQRVLASTGDEAFGPWQSSLLQSNLEVPSGEAWTYFFQFQQTFGGKDRELTLGSEQSAYLGARWAW